MCKGCELRRREVEAALGPLRSALAELRGGDITECRAEASHEAQIRLRAAIARLEPITETRAARAERLAQARADMHHSLAAANELAATAHDQRALAL